MVVLSVLAWITSLIALAFGVLAFRQARRSATTAKKALGTAVWLKSKLKPPPVVLPPITRAEPTSFYLSVVAVVNYGVDYLDEWIRFHRMVGCDHFYIYDNNSTDGTWDLLKRYEREQILTPMRWSDTPRAAHAHALSTFGASSRWMMLIDIDEFVFPTRSDSLKEELHKYEDLPCVVLHWHMFGHSGHKHQPPGLVIENYTRRAAVPHPSHSPDIEKGLTRVKSIVDPTRVRVVKVHCFPNDEGRVYYTLERKPYRRGAWQPSDTDNIVLNHYFTRSEEEWLTKLQSGVPSGKRASDLQSARNVVRDAIEEASVEDLRIQRFVPKLKALMDDRP